MKTPLQIIADYGCPTHSMVYAMQYLGDRVDLTFEQYKKGIQDLIALPEPPEAESYHYAKVLFCFIIQETIRAYNANTIPDMDDLYLLCLKKTRVYIDENPWVATMFNVTHGLLETDDVDAETGLAVIAKTKGGKKEVTERIFTELKTKGASRQDIIDAFVAQTGMSKAGATTYFHSLKKDLGFNESTTDKKVVKTESKQELAERLFNESSDKSKATMIALFTERLNTSKLGAQTYFYACKKKASDVCQL